MAITQLRQLQVSGSQTLDDSRTTGDAMLVSGSLRTLEDDLNNIRSTVKQMTGESSWADPLSTVGGVKRNFKQQRTYLDGLVSGSNKFQAVTVHLNAGDFDVSDPDGAGNAISLDAGAASNFSTSAGDLTVDATAGSLNLTGGEADAAAVKIHADNAAGGIDIDAGTAGIAIDSTGAVSLDAAAASNLTVDGANLTLSTTTSGDVNVSASTDVDIDASGQTYIDGQGGINIGTATDVAIDMDASTLDIDTSGDVTINQSSGNGLWRVEGGGDISISSRDSGNEAYINFQEWGGVYVSGSYSANVDGPRVLIGQTTAPKEFQVTGSSESDSLYSVRSFETLTLGVDATANSENIQNLNFYGTGRAAGAKWTVTQFLTASLGASKMDIDGTDGIDITSGNGYVDIDANNGALSLDGSAGINIGTASDVAIDMDASTLDIDASDAVTIDASADSNFTVDGNQLYLGAQNPGSSISMESKDNTGNFAYSVMYGDTGINYVSSSAAHYNNAPNMYIGTITNMSTFDLDATTVTVDAGTGGLSLDAGAASNLTTSAGALSLDGAGGLNIGTAADTAIDMDASTLDIDASSTINIDGSSIALGGAGSTGAITLDSIAGISLDAAGASNFSTSAGNLTFQGANSDTVVALAAGGVEITGTGNSNFKTVGLLSLSGSAGLDFKGSSVAFHDDGVISQDLAGGILLSSGSADVSSFLSNFDEGEESLLGAINAVYDLASGGSISKSVSRITASLSAHDVVDGIELNSTKWTNDDVNVYVNGVLQTSGSFNQYDVYRDGSNLKLNFDLVTGDVVVVQSF